jgi:hypothetical protein
MRGTFGIFMHSTQPNSRRALSMSPASRAVRDVEFSMKVRFWRKAAVQRKTWVDETLLVYDILVCVDQKLFLEQSGAAWRLVTVIGVWLILKSSWRVASLIRPPTYSHPQSAAAPRRPGHPLFKFRTRKRWPRHGER